MKKTFLIGGLAVLTLASGGAAFAQQTPDRSAGAMRADADGDGRLSRAEFVSQRLQRLSAADANGDGSVSADEMRAAAQARRAGRADVRFDRLDANNDGMVSRAEFDTAREARAERGPRAMRANRGHGQGRMNRMEARGPMAIADVQARTEQAFARLDADNDGYVTAAERQSARQAMREQRRERMTTRRAQRQTSPQAPASE